MPHIRGGEIGRGHIIAFNILNLGRLKLCASCVGGAKEVLADAIRYAFRSVGVALVVNTVILTMGFLVLLTSSFKVNVDMGLLTALAIVFALVRGQDRSPACASAVASHLL